MQAPPPLLCNPPRAPRSSRRGASRRCTGRARWDVHALRGVEFDLYEDELLVLLGVSGSGKSPLLNLLGGLDVPTAAAAARLPYPRPSPRPCLRNAASRRRILAAPSIAPWTRYASQAPR